MTKNSGVKGGTIQQVLRRREALIKLKAQLKYGNKRDKDDKIVPLTDKNIIRIKKEIGVIVSKKKDIGTDTGKKSNAN